MNPSTWILVSDASKGRLFKEAAGKIDFLAEFSHAKSAAHVGDLLSGPAGRRGAGHMDRPALSAVTDPKEVEAVHFARSHARFLKHGLDAHEYQALILVAPSHFLGILRQTLEERVGRLVVDSFAMELAGLDTREVIERLQEVLHTAH